MMYNVIQYLFYKIHILIIRNNSLYNGIGINNLEIYVV